MTSEASLGTVVGDIAREILAGRHASVADFAGKLFRVSVFNCSALHFHLEFEFRFILDLDLTFGFDISFDFGLFDDLTELTRILA